MIVVKDMRIQVLGEPLVEKVALVIRPGERVALVASKAEDASMVLRVLAGVEEADRGTVTYEGERTAYASTEMIRAGAGALGTLHHIRPTFIFFDATHSSDSDAVTQEIVRFIQGYRGGLLIASSDRRIIESAKTTRVFEVQSLLQTVTSYTGTYANFLVEQEKNQARLNEAYEKQQREKRKLEEYLEQKRKEASKKNSSPEKGAIVRATARYLEREILNKEIPNPVRADESPE